MEGGVLNKIVENRSRKFTIFNMTIVLLAFLLTNLRATMFVYLYPNTSVFWGPAWIEIILLLGVSGYAFGDLLRSGRLTEFSRKWRQNWLVGIFVLLALLSVSWSLGPQVTLYRALELLLATFFASYLGLRFTADQWLDFLFLFGAILLIVCIALVYSAPQTGVMDWAPYNGAWRGIYWNRNHLASISALLNAVFLCRFIKSGSERDPAGILDLVFYILSLAVLYFAKSATGFILAILLHGYLLGVWAWLKVKDRLKPVHYNWIGGLAFSGALLLFANLDRVFGLFNRSTTLTGRTGLWNYLLTSVVPGHLWLGHGFGAVWYFDSFRELVRQNVGWTSQPLIADNGYLEILLHLGVVGLVIFLLIFLTLFVRSICHGIGQKTLTGFLPLLIGIYALFANISFSLLAETEVFIWLLIITALFMVTRSRMIDQ